MGNEIEQIKRKINAAPFIDTFDLKYNNFVKHPVPTSQAVMFCLMDVSGSMDQATKDMAKRFYILLYLFLTCPYENLEIAFIRHHTQAKEVGELLNFFIRKKMGGTIVSSALKMMHDIQNKRFPSTEWNVYVACSDGDNWADDSPNCRNIR